MGATDKQKRFIRDLITEKTGSRYLTSRVIETIAGATGRSKTSLRSLDVDQLVDSLSKREASRVIDALR